MKCDKLKVLNIEYLFATASGLFSEFVDNPYEVGVFSRRDGFPTPPYIEDVFS